MTSKAYAKINLTLDVIAKRADGYHDIASVMQTVSLFDLLTFRIEERNDENNEIIITSSDETLPCNEKNLCYKACTLLLKEFDIHGKTVYIDIDKNIPVGAGLGGGSSDCAETLKALNELLGINIPYEELEKLGAAIGADVPFFIEGGCRKAEGIGDILTDLDNVKNDYFIILAKPSDNLLTETIYCKFDELYKESPDVFPLPSTEKFISEKDHLKKFMHVSNMLSPVSERADQAISNLKKKLRSLGALAAEMTGSGPTVFALFENEKAAIKAFTEIEKHIKTSFCGIFKTEKIIKYNNIKGNHYNGIHGSQRDT